MKEGNRGALDGLLSNPIGLLGAVGIGSVFGAIYTARATDRRERHAWQRDQQIRAYGAFQDALWASYFRITGGEARRAKSATSEEGIEKLIDGHPDDLEEITRTVHAVITYGDRKVAFFAAGLASAWEQWIYEATPLSGAQCWPSTWQQQQALNSAHEALTYFAFQVRRSLGRLNPRLWLKVALKARPIYRTDHPIVEMSQKAMVEGTAVSAGSMPRSVLIDWRVRDCTAQIPSPERGYCRTDTPWASLKVDHQNYFHPIAAIALKRPRHPWSLAIEGRLPKETIYQLELDAVRLITGNTGAWPLKLSASNWVPGEQEGDRVYLWLIEDLVQRGCAPSLLSSHLRNLTPQTS
ncbi:hypothetical protein GS575_07600 [Rhodococcus hoagii]|nr:hypothetical protein [Prescottella equi]